MRASARHVGVYTQTSSDSSRGDVDFLCVCVCEVDGGGCEVDGVCVK